MFVFLIMSMFGRALSVGTFLKPQLRVGSSRKDLTCMCPMSGFPPEFLEPYL